MELLSVSISPAIVSKQIEMYCVSREYQIKNSEDTQIVTNYMAFYDSRKINKEGQNTIPVFYFSEDSSVPDDVLDKVNEFCISRFALYRDIDYTLKTYPVSEDIMWGESEHDDANSFCYDLQECFDENHIDIKVPIIKSSEFRYMHQKC